MADKPQVKKDESGRFLKGNIGGPGRPKGSGRQQLAREFIESLQKTWSEHGDTVLARLVDDDPASVLRAMVAIMPKEIDLNVNRFDDMSLEQLKNQYAALAREARALGLDFGAGDSASLH
jgi:hypothetical protein